MGKPVAVIGSIQAISPAKANHDAQGREQGISKIYYSNGSLKTTTAYQNGEKHGSAQSYAADGTLQSTTHYCHDAECSPAQKYSKIK